MKLGYLFVVAAFATALSVGTVSAQETTPKVINGGVLNGKAISLPKPEYPVAAKAAHVEGIVRVEVIIDENGNIEAAKAVKPEGEESELSVEVTDAWAALRDASERAALEARFSPTLLSGQPVKVRGQITYNFLMSGKEKVISGGILNGKAVELPQPAYPAAAKAVKVSGPVSVQVTIDEEGNVISASALSGHPLLQAAAVAAARAARFAPTLLDGQPVKVTGVITYNFAMSDKQQ